MQLLLALHPRAHATPMSTDEKPFTPYERIDAYEVFAYWQRTYDRPKCRFTDNRIQQIVGFLRAGFTIADLCRALDHFREDPSLVNGRSLTSNCTAILRDPETVQRLLDKQRTVPREARLKPYDDVWEARYGGKLPYGIAAKYLFALEAKHGADDVLARFTRYVHATPGVYVSIPRFAQTFGEWGPNARPANAHRTSGLDAGGDFKDLKITRF